MRPSKWSSERAAAEEGTASLEFLVAGVILLVPLIYLVLALAALQAGAMAVEGAARQAARVYVQSATATEARERAARAVEFALTDHGLKPDTSTLDIDCVSPVTHCLTRSGMVQVTVRVRVPLPLVPDVLNLERAASIPVEATSVHEVSRFWRAP